MRPATLVVSAVLHVLLFVVMFVVIPAPRSQAVQATVIQVSSVVDGVPSPAPPPKKKTEQRAKMEPDRTPNKPRDQVKKLPKGEEEEPQPVSDPEDESEPESEEATVGAGLAAGVKVDAVNFEFTYYLIALRNRIGQNWSAPAGVVSRGQPVKTTVYFRIQRDGRVVEPRVENSSGINFFDQSAVRAVLISNPVPPLPMGYEGEELGVHFDFEYTGS